MRLDRSYQFAAVREKGASVRGKYLRLSALRVEEAAEEKTRVGIITSRRLGGAVARVRMRRVLREIHRLNQRELLSGYWLVVIPHREAVGVEYGKLYSEWLRLAAKLSILHPR